MASPLSADQLETLLRGKWTRIFETMDIAFTPVPSKPRARPAHPGDSHPALPTPYSCVSSSRRCSASYITVSHALHACSIPSTAPRPTYNL